MSDEKENKEKAIFEEAFNALDNEQIFEGKFGKPGEQFQTAELPLEEEIELVKEVQDLRLMEDTFGFVEKRDHSKYWIPSDNTEEDLFAPLLDESEKPAKNDVMVVTHQANKKSRWDTIADASSDAIVIYVGDLFETSATRELSHRLQAGKFFRVVYGGKNGFTKELLTRYLKNEDFGNLKADFVFSPDSKENDGLAIVKIK